ncbi:MAG TPA: acetoacetate decarboxylase family protein [Syntrophorhabdaceae bacterium]|nr:acetoacetate decarboxylase family protein [Syntrophorhabdaceae bacterium]
MFKLEENKTYRMPAHFGGWVFDPDAKAVYNDVVGLTYTYRTDEERLLNYIPEGFELTAPEVQIAYQECRQVEWMAGSYYNLITIAVPVRFNGKRDHIEGAYALVVWENKTTPILTGNQMGVPKIFADIENLHIFGETYFTRASFEGNTFLKLEIKDPKPVDKAQLDAMTTDVNSLGWRYIPKVGGPGADLSQFILFPMRSEVEHAWTGQGKVEWIELKMEENPMQYPIIKALTELPIFEMAPVVLTKGKMILMEARGRVLE